MKDNFNTKIITLVLIGALFVLAYLIVKPILIAILFGLIFAYVLRPVYTKINKHVRIPNLSTALLITIILVIIAIPLWFLTPVIVGQTFDTFMSLQRIDVSASLAELLPGVLSPETLSSISEQFNNLIGKIFSSFLNQFTAFLVNIPNLLLQFAVFIFTFYFAIRDADKLKSYVAKLSPLSPSTEKTFLKEFRGITDAIVFGQVLIGIIQGLAMGIGLFLLGVPSALILTILAILFSIIPVLGPFLIWLPVSLYLLITGNIFGGVFLLLYGALFVSTIDNVLRPLLLARNSKLPVAVGVIGTIGGLYYFGLVGLILGPLVLAYIMIILEFYSQGKFKELFRTD